MSEQDPLQSALVAIDKACPDYSDERGRLVATKCAALMRGYDARWKNAGYVPLSVEDMLVSPLYNPSTQRKSRRFSIAGKRDLVCMEGGRRVLFDHKTTSDSIEDPDGTFWRQLAIEGQVDHYLLLSLLLGERFDFAVWDVIKKPTISPKKLTKKERASIAAFGEYCGLPVSGIGQQWVVNSDRETHELYGLRLADDCINVRPSWYFQRRTVSRMDFEILEYAEELWSHQQDIGETRRNERWVRNPGACMMYGSPCRYLGICSNADTPDSDHWTRRENVHEELPTLNGHGRDVLTNSCIRCFQTCRRKFYYRYELGLKRIDEEEREPLFFGHVIHKALEAWWTAIKENRHDDNSGSPVNAVGQH